MKKIFLCLFLISCIACNKDDDHSGIPPAITDVKDISGSVGASTKGSTIEIIGENLEDVRILTFNGYEADLTIANISGNKIQVVIPEATPSIEEKAVDDLIILETPGGVAAYDFIILPPAPEITALSNESPAAGESITITGTYLFYVQSVSFPASEELIVTEFAANSSGKEITVTVPGGYNPSKGSIWVTTLSGRASVKPNDPSGERLEITDLKYVAPVTYAVWKVKENLQIADFLYVDRTTESSQLKSAPEDYLGATWISTSTDGRGYLGDEPLASFTLNREADVYVMWNQGGGKLPEWLESWEAIEPDRNDLSKALRVGLTASNPDTFWPFRKTFPAGTVELYRNGEKNTNGGNVGYNTNRAPYFIVIK